MVLDFVKDVYRAEIEGEVKRICKIVDTTKWTDEMIESFLLGYKIGVGK